MSVVKKYFFVFASILLSVKSFAQAPSPYTTLGMGEPYGNALINTQGMAGVGVSQPQWWFLNNQNPALLVYNTLTVFEAGLVTEQRTIRTSTEKEKATGGNMNYLITAFPILPPQRPGETSRWTTSIGLMPLTSVAYRFQYDTLIQNSTEKVRVTEEGSGGLTQLFWSNGVRISDNFSAGLKASYIFSSVVNSYKNDLPSSATPVGYVVSIEEETYVRDFNLGLGFSYSQDSIGPKKLRLSVGAVANLGTDLKSKRTTSLLRMDGVGSNLDTAAIDEIKGQVHLPPAFTFGVSLSRNINWSLGTEFSMQDWSKFRGMNSEDNEGLGPSWRWALGGEFTPDPFAAENFLKRITFRLGVSYEKTPYAVPRANPTDVKDIGATFGLSLPTGRSSIDLAFKYGQRGDKKVNLIEESYFNIYLGVTFNDQWFIKRKFD
jgi:hypothetical protein